MVSPWARGTLSEATDAVPHAYMPPPDRSVGPIAARPIRVGERPRGHRGGSLGRIVAW